MSRRWALCFGASANGQDAWFIDPAYNSVARLSISSTTPQRSQAHGLAGRTRVARHRSNHPGAAFNERAAAGPTVVQRTYRLALLNDPTYADYSGAQNVLAEKVTLI